MTDQYNPTPADIEAMTGVLLNHADGDIDLDPPGDGRSFTRDVANMLMRLSASPSPPPSAGVDAVRALEWRSHVWGAEADGGRYRIEDNGTNWTDDRYWLFVNVGLLSNHRSKFATLDEAKAAAQADYEARIRSALTPAPAPVEAGGEAVQSWLASELLRIGKVGFGYDITDADRKVLGSAAAYMAALAPAAQAVVSRGTTSGETQTGLSISPETQAAQAGTVAQEGRGNG